MNKTTIIMPVHNSGENLVQAIESILNSTAHNYELLLIDDGSTDGSEKIVDAYADRYCHIRTFHLPTRNKPEQYDGRLIYVFNYGIRQADPESDIYLTHDDTVHFKLFKRDWLRTMAIAAEDESIGIVTSIFAWGISDEQYLKAFRWIGTWSMYIPRRTIDSVGVFDENFIVGDDIDYTYRVIQSGLSVYVCNFWVDHHRQTDHAYSDKETEEQKDNDYHELVLKSGKYFREKHKL